jgi:hypothetical protein
MLKSESATFFVVTESFYSTETQWKKRNVKTHCQIDRVNGPSEVLKKGFIQKMTSGRSHKTFFTCSLRLFNAKLSGNHLHPSVIFEGEAYNFKLLPSARLSAFLILAADEHSSLFVRIGK